jgi:hypothetical protein
MRRLVRGLRRGAIRQNRQYAPKQAAAKTHFHQANAYPKD